MSGIYTPQAPITDDPNFWGGLNYSPALSRREDVIMLNIQSLISDYFTTNGVVNIEVKVFPDVPTDGWWKNLQSPAYVLIAYRTTDNDKPATTSSMVQESTVSVELKLLVRQIEWKANSKTPGMAFVLQEAIKGALTGARIPGCRTLYFRGFQFDEQGSRGEVWIYTMPLEIRTFQLALSPVDQYGNLQQLRFLLDSKTAQTKATVASMTFDSSGVIQLPVGNVISLVLSNQVTGTVYGLNVDYTADYPNGIITVIQGGSLSAGSTVVVQYTYGEMVETVYGQGSTPGVPSNVPGVYLLSDNVPAMTD